MRYAWKEKKLSIAGLDFWGLTKIFHIKQTTSFAFHCLSHTAQSSKIEMGKAWSSSLKNWG